MEILKKFFSTIGWTDVLSVCLRITLILFIAWIITLVAKRVLVQVEKRILAKTKQEGETPSEAEKRIQTITRLLRQATKLSIWIIASLILLREIGVDIGPILAGAGIVGLAVGFGAQNLVRDIISGSFMILENQVRVNDVAIINGTGGLVERINFRTIVLRDLSGTVHVFPNGSIDTLSNLTKGWSAYVFDIGVAYKEDTDRVIEVLSKVGKEMFADQTFAGKMLEEPEIFGVDKFADSAVIIKGRIRTMPIQQWGVGREFLRRVKLAFDRENIEIPFPHRTLYMGDSSKPFDVKVLEKLQGKTD